MGFWNKNACYKFNLTIIDIDLMIVICLECSASTDIIVIDDKLKQA